MAVSHAETSRTKGMWFLVTHLRLRDRLGVFLAGLAQAVDRNCYWFRSYVTLACAAIFIYSALAHTLPGFDLVTSLALELASLALITAVLAWGRRLYHLNRQRRFPQLVMVVTVIASFICLTVPALSFGQLVTVPLLAGAAACLLASIPMFFILILPGTTFNPDFAHLGMFQRYRRILELGSGFVLFVVAAQQLVFYPQPIWTVPPSPLPSSTMPVSITPLSADDFLMKIAAPEVPLKFLNDVVLNGLAILLILFILILATWGLYVSLAHRLWQRSVAETFTGAYGLLKKNLLYHLTGEGYAIWPKSPTQRAADKATNPKHENLLERFYFSSSLPAVTLAFGLWTLKVTAANADSFLVMIVLIFFFAGGVWLRAIEVTGVKGPSFTFGLWLGTLLLYWPTTLMVVVGIRSITLVSQVLPQAPDLAALQNTFVLWYRAAVGALTLLIALSRSKYVFDEPGSPRSLRYGLAAIALLVLLSFVVNGASQLVGTGWAGLGGFTIIIIIAAILFVLPQRRKSGSTVDPLGAQLIVSSSLAVAPLLFSQRIDSINWTNEGHADLVVKNVGIAPKPYRLRTYVVGSEEEVGFEVMNKAHTQLRGPFDFVLTDLRTAIRIMGAHRHHWDRYATNYRILMVVATMPWKQVDVSRGQDQPAAERLILDVGYLRFNSAFKVPDDPDSPRTNTPHLCRPGSLSTVAYYAANHCGDVSKVYLTEPYSSWLLRQIDQQQDSANKTESKLPVVYVLLARYHELTDPAVSYNWCRTMCEMIEEGQKLARENQSIINHVQLHKLHTFLQEATGSQVELSLEDIQLALCRTRFEPCFSVAAKHDCIQALQEMATHDLISQPLKTTLLQRLKDGEDIGSVLCDALEHGNMPMRYDGQTKDDDFFKRFYQACSPAISSQLASAEAQQYLHSLFLVSLSDRPGRLAELLQKLQAEEHAERIDLALVATENLGDSALIYLLDRQALPQLETPTALVHGQLLERRIHSIDGLDRMRQAGVDAIEVKAFIIAVQHEPGSLHEVISKLRGVESDVNLEQVFAFPLSHDLAIAILIVRQDQQQEVLRRLQNVQVQSPTTPASINLPGSSVELTSHIVFRRHKQQVTFDIALKAGANVEFKCPNLATWTPSWGAIDNWIAEVGFDEVRLKIPTTLAWQIAAIGWMADIPLAGKFIKQALRRSVPGIAGLAEYRKSDNWWIVSKQPDTKHNAN